LSRFNLTLKYVQGTKMEKADRLSRKPDWKIGIEKNNENQIFIKNCWLYSLYEVVIEEPEVDIVEKIKKAKGRDKEIVRVVKEIKNRMLGIEMKLLTSYHLQMNGQIERMN